MPLPPPSLPPAGRGRPSSTSCPGRLATSSTSRQACTAGQHSWGRDLLLQAFFAFRALGMALQSAMHALCSAGGQPSMVDLSTALPGTPLLAGRGISVSSRRQEQRRHRPKRRTGCGIHHAHHQASGIPAPQPACICAAALVHTVCSDQLLTPRLAPINLFYPDLDAQARKPFISNSPDSLTGLCSVPCNLPAPSARLVGTTLSVVFKPSAAVSACPGKQGPHQR